MNSKLARYKPLKKFYRPLGSLLLLLALLAQSQVTLYAQTATPEQKTARYFESVRTQPSLLLTFLRRMPKGADLHNHLSGAIYAESFIRWAKQDNLCVNPTTLVLSDSSTCNEAAGIVPAEQALKDGVLYRRMIDAWSMRNWELSGQSGHDHFFDTFGKFSQATYLHLGDMLAEEASRAAEDRLSYVELMTTPDGGKASQLGKELQATHVGKDLKWDTQDFEQMREWLAAHGLNDALAASRKNLDDAEAAQRNALNCGTAQADAGCNVRASYIYQVARAGSREQVFAQILTGLALASADPRVVALNLVQAEDGFVPMTDFSLHMRMLDYLHGIYPKSHITLHAGELTLGVVQPEGLRFHIRESVEKGHAERIGHGVDVMFENDPIGLLRELSEQHVMVEICLTSNDVILGVRGRRHPLAMYLRYDVPVALATDDLGVSRSDMTHEYLKAAEEQELSYTQLKMMARNSLEYSFVGGASLWRDRKRSGFAQPCAAERPGDRAPATACRQFLASNERARLQWELEKAFAEFERGY